MSEPQLSRVDAPAPEEIEEADGLPVPAGPAPSEVRTGPRLSPAAPGSSLLDRVPTGAGAQAAAVAATGFVAGATVAGLVQRRRRRRLLEPGRARQARRPTGAAGELVQIVASRSLLVDVHLLGGRQ